MKIAHLDFGEKPLFLAPMEGVTDPSFRYMCRSFGADMAYPEFVASDELLKEVPKTMQKLDIKDDKRPVGIQIYGHIPQNMVEAAKIVTEYQPDILDINAGCPAKKIQARGAGSGLLRNVPAFVAMVADIVKATHLPVTVKTRIGWDDQSKNIVEVSERLQDVGVQAITVHGRTGKQKFTGLADWEMIAKVKNNPRLHIPVIGNGDICSGEIAHRMFTQYGVDAIMIGRAAMGRPWVFSEIRHFLNTGSPKQLPSAEELVQMALLHFRKSLYYKGSPRGVYEMRRHFTRYFSHLDSFASIKEDLMQAIEPEHVESLLQKIAL